MLADLSTTILYFPKIAFFHTSLMSSEYRSVIAMDLFFTIEFIGLMCLEN